MIGAVARRFTAVLSCGRHRQPCRSRIRAQPSIIELPLSTEIQQNLHLRPTLAFTSLLLMQPPLGRLYVGLGVYCLSSSVEMREELITRR